MLPPSQPSPERRADPRVDLARREIQRRVPLSASGPEQQETGLRAFWLLLAGAAIGLTLATFGLLEPRGVDGTSLSPEIAALVGERTIRRIDYERVLAGVESDLRNPVDEAMRRRVLERMIDEELLVQRALELGLAVVDRRVRGELTSGLIDSVVSEADSAQPSAEDVERHYDANRDFFTRPGRVRARTILFSRRGDEDGSREPAEQRAARAKELLAGGEAPAEVERRWGDPQVSPPPDTLLPPGKLRDYVGPKLLEAVMALEVGAWSEPIESGGGLYLAWLIDREPPVTPPLAEIETLVRQDLRRRRGDDALRRYLETLRGETPVEINEAVFEPRVAASAGSP